MLFFIIGVLLFVPVFFVFVKIVAYHDNLTVVELLDDNEFLAISTAVSGFLSLAWFVTIPLAITLGILYLVAIQLRKLAGFVDSIKITVEKEEE